jgi:hypothetical protein
MGPVKVMLVVLFLNPNIKNQNPRLPKQNGGQAK